MGLVHCDNVLIDLLLSDSLDTCSGQESGQADFLAFQFLERLWQFGELYQLKTKFWFYLTSRTRKSTHCTNPMSKLFSFLLFKKA
mmetsp:Transcript_4067/g.5431  ORF Transcript_4067/g.5431 Transcript_4067/m.5431 type:complete len:85 (-) Transcript_4067:1397-1651(-)